jgi:hypothetical protein
MRLTDRPAYVNPYPGPQRRRRDAMNAPLPGYLGWYAGSDVPHPFRPLGPTAGAPLCADCFGFTDDPRHP